MKFTLGLLLTTLMGCSAMSLVSCSLFQPTPQGETQRTQLANGLQTAGEASSSTGLPLFMAIGGILIGAGALVRTFMKPKVVDPNLRPIA